MRLDDLLKIKLGVSAIHGIGVLARTDIKAGERLYADQFPMRFVADIPQDILGRHPYAYQDQTIIYPDVRFLAYMNHSNTPNYDPVTDTALMDIKEGDEITEDYRLLDNYREIYPWVI